jgi:TolA-binding protein
MEQVMKLQPFFDVLRHEQDRAREQAGYLQQAQMRSAVNQGRRKARNTAAKGFAIGGAFALAASLALAWQHFAKAPAFFVGEGSQAGSVGAFIAAPNASELPLRFADGTRIALSAGTSARVASLDEHGAHIVLEKGSAVASVMHRTGSHWQVDVGPYQVAVVGTRFDVSWDAGERVLTLHLQQGAVLVSGGFLRDALRVQAGQTLRAFSDGGRVELLGPTTQATAAPSTVGAAPAAETAPPVEATPPADVATPSALRVVPVAAPAWQALASSGKYREALAAAEKLGFEAECRRASGPELLTLADAARLAGSTARAEQAYSAAHSKLSGGGRASYGLGLVAFDQRGDFAGAARWFDTYLREQPNGSLRAEATGRLLEALQRSGQKERARGVAEQYLARYPHGAQAALAQQLLR